MSRLGYQARWFVAASTGLALVAWSAPGRAASQPLVLGPEIPAGQPSPGQGPLAAAFNGNSFLLVSNSYDASRSPADGDFGTRLNATGVVLDQTPLALGGPVPFALGSTSSGWLLVGSVSSTSFEGRSWSLPQER